VKLDLRFLSSLSLVAALGFGTGCPADDDGGDTGADTDPGSTGSTDPTTDPSDPTTDPSDPTTDPTETSATTTTSDPTTGETDDPTSGETDDPTGDPLPDGSDCTMDEQCESGHCYMTGLGSVCGECSGDADCDGGGCSLPNPLVDPPTGSTCNAGELGDGCENADACTGELLCVNIVNLPGVLVANTCSECETTADCDGELVCNVAVDVANITGEKTCVATESVADGEFCDIEGDGDAACMGHCSAASIMGLLEFGVCGACRNVDGMAEGCEAGQTCVDSEVELDGSTVPSFCE